ncbi:serine hydrolase domain-containing protein [Metabacillus sp. 84]|uniref:serine hydrolase domain-containing protein n=1 Tax=Metabacillus sp. 84 TaxID=3404705 RepID=UPI003CF109D8
MHYLSGMDMDQRLNEYTAAGVSIAVIEEGRAVWHGFGLRENGTGGKITSSTVFSACSISKFAAALLALKLVSEGQLDLDEDVNRKLKSWMFPGAGVTLRHLLSHQSGILDPENSFMEFTFPGPYPLMKDILEGNTVFLPAPAVPVNKPGSVFRYSDAGFCVVEQVISDVLDSPFTEAVSKLIFAPLGLRNSFYLFEDGKGELAAGHNHKGEVLKPCKYPVYPYPASAGLWSAPLDMCKLIGEVMNAWKGKSAVGITQALAEEMTASQGCSPFTGLGCFLDSADGELEISSLGWGAGFQSMLFAYPQRGTGAVIMMNADLGVHQMKGLIGEIYKELRPRLVQHA